MNMKLIISVMCISIGAACLLASDAIVAVRLEVAEYQMGSPVFWPDKSIKRNTSNALQRPIEIAVMGCVVNPGRYYVEEGFTAAGVIELAGGYRNTAAVDKFYIANRHEEGVWVLRNLDITSRAPPVKVLARWVVRDGDIIHIHEIM